MKGKNGFTLVELLAVIVILAVVMTIAVTAVAPIMDRSQKGALGSEGLLLVDAAQMAYQAQQMASGDDKIIPGANVCFGLNWLKKKEYYTSKKNLDNYTGSVLVSYTGNGGYSYTFWITDGAYAFVNDDGGTGYAGVKNYSSDNAIKVTTGNESAIKTAATKCNNGNEVTDVQSLIDAKADGTSIDYIEGKDTPTDETPSGGGATS